MLGRTNGGKETRMSKYDKKEYQKFFTDESGVHSAAHLAEIEARKNLGDDASDGADSYADTKEAKKDGVYEKETQEQKKRRQYTTIAIMASISNYDHFSYINMTDEFVNKARDKYESDFWWRLKNGVTEEDIEQLEEKQQELEEGKISKEEFEESIGNPELKRMYTEEELARQKEMRNNLSSRGVSEEELNKFEANRKLYHLGRIEKEEFIEQVPESIRGIFMEYKEMRDAKFQEAGLNEDQIKSIHERQMQVINRETTYQEFMDDIPPEAQGVILDLKDSFWQQSSAGRTSAAAQMDNENGQITNAFNGASANNPQAAPQPGLNPGVEPTSQPALPTNVI